MHVSELICINMSIHHVQPTFFTVCLQHLKLGQLLNAVFLCFAGIAGGVPLAAAATDGITIPVLYNPYLAAGSRYTELADSAIQRLYHSNAFLLTSGLVCDSLSFSVMQSICMSDNSDSAQLAQHPKLIESKAA